MHEDGGKFEVLIKGYATYGLAVDKLNKVLYWFKNNTDLVMSSLTGEDMKTLFGGLTSPRDIVLYEEKGKQRNYCRISLKNRKYKCKDFCSSHRDVISTES